MHQQGITLVLSLMMLSMLSLLVITGAKVGGFQEKMAYHHQDKSVSFQMAEAGIKTGENWIMGLSAPPAVVNQCSTKPCVQTLNSAVSPENNSFSWWQQNGTQYAGTQQGAATSPYYIVQFLRFVPDTPTLGQSPQQGVYYYRVTSYGTGATDQAVSVVQTTYSRRF